jgi:hypothetical protein
LKPPKCAKRGSNPNPLLCSPPRPVPVALSAPVV